MKGTFVGLKHSVGESKKDGKHYDFWTANIVTDMSENDVEKREAVGLETHSPSVPKSLLEVLTKANVGKHGEFEFYFANGREQLGYAKLFEDNPKKGA